MLMNAPGADAAIVLAPPAQARVLSLARAPAEAPAADVRVALARLLAGVAFVKARRTSRLLQFLVERRLANAVRDINEYTIGIEVFERDPATFSPGEDPVVRVQVGRLREKLKLYYATVAPRPEIVFAIPTGSYMPVIEHSRGGVELSEPGRLLALMPLTCIADGAAWSACAAFTRGLSEELTHLLFQQFGNKVVAPSFSNARQPDAAAPAAARLGHVLEGSVRVDGELIRLSIRLVGAGDGIIAWSQQFDRCRALTIALQEELGYFVCAAVKRHFCHD
jgi:TolB-like protein